MRDNTILRSSLAALALVACGCGDDPAGAPGTLSALVRDAETGEPIADAVVAIEQGGIYVENPDPSRGNPAYQFGARTDSDGAFVVALPGGSVGLHVFANGYRYAPKRVQVDGDVSATIDAEANLALDRVPTVTGSTIDPPTSAPGAEVVLRTTARAADADADPLSEETVAIQPDSAWAAVLDPPSAGEQGVAFPDGAYSLTIRAPTTPGAYVYAFVTTTEHCITSDREEVTLTVE